MKILIADDDEDYRQTIRDILICSGHKVVEARDGQEAIMTYHKDNNFDLVITDFNMPNGTGLVVIEEIRAIQPEARIWLASNVMDDELENRAIKLGAEKAIWKMQINEVLLNL